MALFDRRHNQWVARSLREQYGMELTPDELDELRREAYATIRMQMRERGWAVPDSDEELYLWIQEAIENDDGPPRR